MSLSAPFRKLWIKIALATAIISWVGMELIIQISLKQSLEETHHGIQKSLQDIGSMGAALISGEEHTAALAHTPEAHIYFEKIRNQMNIFRRRIGFKEEWYTLLPNTGDTTSFGIMTHEHPFSGDRHIFRDTAVRHIFENALLRQQSGATNVYKDDYGIWISGFAPIVNQSGTTAAVLEVDIRYEEYLQREQAIYNRAAWLRAFGLIIGGLLGMLLGYVIAKPIRKVADAVNDIAEHNYQGSVSIPLTLQYLPDETTRLIINFNQMAAKLAETLQDLRLANERLLSLDRAKTVFLEFIAHELRTPLNGLKFLNVLPDLQPLEPDTREVLDGAIESAQRLEKFALAAERYIKALTHSPNFEEILPLNEVLPALVDEYRLIAAVEEVDILFSCPANPMPVPIPYDILVQMLTPVVSNAIKFSCRKGIIEMAVEIDNSCVLFWIRDHGRGFPPETAERLFEPFFVSEIEHHSQGTGVSLSIAKVLARHYNGDLKAQSAGISTGSTFIFSFSLASFVSTNFPAEEEILSASE